MTGDDLLQLDVITPLARRQPWVRTACTRIAVLFSDPHLARLAAMVSALHPHIIDYVEQAPVLIVALSQGRSSFSERELQRIGLSFLVACHGRPKLNALLRARGLTPPLRALNGRALRLSVLPLLQRLSTLPPRVLAPAIPSGKLQQRLWFLLLEEWVRQAPRYSKEPDFALSWAASRLASVNLANFTPQSVREVCGFVMTRKTDFNPGWTFNQAMAAMRLASAQANGETARAMTLKETAEFHLRHGFTQDVVIDKAALAPTTCGDFTVVPLRTPRDVVNEGDAMSHCAARYVKAVAEGNCRLFSLRRNGRRPERSNSFRGASARARPMR